MPDASGPMRTGALVMIDALGFRGVWKDHDPLVVVRKLHGLRDRAEEDSRNSEVQPHIAYAKASFLSDTVVVGVEAKEPAIIPAKMHALSILSACYRVSRVLESALNEEPWFAYRGCVAYGAFAIDGPFLLGPAVDEAASHYEKADGAFVWLTPGAKPVLEVTEAARKATHPVVTYRVPMKGGSSFESWVVSPYGLAGTTVTRAAVRKRLLMTFDKERSLEVQIKRQNTAGFLDHLDQRIATVEAD